MDQDSSVDRCALSGAVTVLPGQLRLPGISFEESNLSTKSSDIERSSGEVEAEQQRSACSDLGSTVGPDGIVENGARANDRFLVSSVETMEAIRRGIEQRELAGIPISELHVDEETALGVLRRWKRMMSQCRTYLVELSCNWGHYRRVRNECHCPACPGEESLKIKKWGRTAQSLVDCLPPDERWGMVKRFLGTYKPKFPKRQPNPGEKMIWIALEMGLRDTGQLKTDIDRTFTLRRDLWDKAASMGAVAGVGIIDVGLRNGGHPHLHFLLYAPYLPIGELRSWLQAKDCSVPGCSHPPNDRCDRHIARRESCDCLDNGRVRCNGSWHADIRRAYSPWQALEYFIRIDASTRTWEEKAELRVASFLATYKKHRVEQYGLARPRAGLPVAMRDHDPRNCPICGEWRRVTAIIR